jgi:hypothetical protein
MPEEQFHAPPPRGLIDDEGNGLGVVVFYRWPLALFHRARLSRWKLLSTLISMAGLAALAFVAGGAAMFYQVPPSRFLEQAFWGAGAWHDRWQTRDEGRRLSAFSVLPGRTVVDRPEETFDGFTLVVCNNPSRPSTQAVLIDMRRQVVHQWSRPSRTWWPDPPNLRGLPSDTPTCFFSCYLYPQGDLLVTYHGPGKQTGCGLAKLDKDSNIVWAYRGHVHHDVDVARDGAVYALEHRWVDEPPAGLDGIASPWLDDYLLTLSPEGTLIREPISLMKALRDSPYAALLSSLERAGRPRASLADVTAPRVGHGGGPTSDPLHANFVKILSDALAPRFPSFKGGQLLVSLRNINVIAMLEPEAGRIVWAARGPWQAQHDPEFLDNGHLLIFDNHGSPVGSRVLEWDPLSGGVPWSYPDPPQWSFFTNQRGMSQRLPNGNTLIVNTEGEELVEVTTEKNIVWTCLSDGVIQYARRYSASEVPFLDGPRPRP